MPKRSEDPFAFSSGLPNDIDVTFGEAYFATTPEYHGGATTCLLIPYECDDPDVDTSRDLLYPCGDGWEAIDRGVRIQDEKGDDDRVFNQQSGVALFVAAALEAGARDIIIERSEGEGPYRADIWQGLKFHMERREHGKGQFKSERLYPTAFLGVEGEAKPAASVKSAAAKRTTTKAAASEAPANTTVKEADPPAASGGPDGLSTKQQVKLRDVARKVRKAGGDHDQFVEEAMAAMDPTTPEVEAAIMDESEEGIWAGTAG